MASDRYVRVVLTIIAAALVYLCVVLTPIPVVSAQTGRVVGGKTPGEYTGPAEVVIVGWRLAEGGALPVDVTRGNVSVTNEVRVTGRVEAVPLRDTIFRSLLIGFEDARSTQPVSFDQAGGRGLPVVVLPAKP